MVETANLGNNSTGGGGGIGDVAAGDAGGGGGGVPSGLPFQVGYREAGQEYTLYLLAAREQDRAEWIRAIRAGKSPISLQLLPSRTFHAIQPRSDSLVNVSCQSRSDKRVSTLRLRYLLRYLPSRASHRHTNVE